MLGIDPRAFIVISAAFGILCSIILFALHFGFPREIKGLDRWGRGCASMAAAAVLFALRGYIPVWLSSWVANLMVAAGVIAMHSSLRDFSGLPRLDRHITLLLGITALVLAWTTFVHDDYKGRILTMTSALTILFGACFWTVARQTGKGFAEHFTQYLFLSTTAITFSRFVAGLNQDESLTTDSDTTLIHLLYMGTFSFSIVGLSLGFILMVNRALHMKLAEQAIRDHLTGTFRRDAFMERLEHEIEASTQLNRPLAVLMIDLDNFKAINDRYGHTVGDLVIKDFSAKITQVMRRNDCVGRYGGEEFIALLPYTEETDAQAIAERIRESAARIIRNDIPAYTVSIGLARLNPTMNNAPALIDAADRAMYMAKQAGKNRVEIALVAASRTADPTINHSTRAGG